MSFQIVSWPFLGLAKMSLGLVKMLLGFFIISLGLFKMSYGHDKIYLGLVKKSLGLVKKSLVIVIMSFCLVKMSLGFEKLQGLGQRNLELDLKESEILFYHKSLRYSLIQIITLPKGSIYFTIFALFT